MDIVLSLLDGIWIALHPANFGLAIAGVIIGLFVGAMPGLGSVNGVAILLPFTFVIQEMTGTATSPMIFLAAIYYGAMYGGAISSLTLGIPGASTAVATTFDGRPLALKGQAHKALVVAALASFVGATVSNILFTAFAPPLASVALKFGDPEIFALMLLAFATFIGLGGDDIPKTLFSICFGLVLATVGFDIVSGEPRLIFFDIQGFSHGIRFLVLAIGVYGIGEMIWTICVQRGDTSMSDVKLGGGRILRAILEFKEAWKGTAIGSAIGFFVGILPAAGATPGSLMAYGVTKMVSRNPRAFGKGEVDGVAAPEAANNSASTGAMLPMMTLGIPGS
ncbi:MAG: tripartite tricarboxylate transporter permease, partial [Limibacillus sp.]